MTNQHPTVRRCLELAVQGATASNSHQQRVMLETMIGLQWQKLERSVYEIVGDESGIRLRIRSARECALKALGLAAEDPVETKRQLAGVREDLHRVQTSIDRASKRT